MRIDKYLKVARILKRRTIAKELADLGRLIVNGRPVKASYEVKVNDEIDIIFGHRILSVRVLMVAQYAKKEDACLMYEVLGEKTNDDV